MEDNSATQAVALFHRGEQHLESAAWALAEHAFRQAIALVPRLAEAHANLGYVRNLQGDPAEAESCYRTSIDLNPGSSTVHLNLGALLVLQKRHAEAEACYAAALALEPESSAVWSNLGALNLNLQREDTAEACLRHAMALDPSNARARFNLAYLQLRRGKLEEGWSLFEARDWYQVLEQQLDIPRWTGETLHGKSLLVGYEAGHGDMIQFCRYIPWLKAQGTGHITLLCHPALKSLMQTLLAVDRVCGFDEDLPPLKYDLWLPMLSSPFLAQTRMDSIPGTLPYLQSDAALRTKWESRLPGGPGLRVGLAWKGNPRFENDSDRSLPHLQTLQPLWEVPGLQFISLQKGEGESEATSFSALQLLTELGSQMQDFADAAAVVDQLDLVITVDTAIAHLAGALGKPCWLLLPWYMTDWRWGAADTQTPWYPGVMRLFRQQRDGDWDTVVQEVAYALSNLSGMR